MEKKTISLIGSTGSIGTQALEVIKHLDYKVCALSANQNIQLLEKQCRAFRPSIVCIYDKSKYPALKECLSDMSVKIVAGMEGLCEIASFSESDLLLNAVVGMVGLRPTLEAIAAKKNIALANKETLVVGGELVMKCAKKNKVKILPIDSEHSAIFQCLQGNNSKQLRRILLTASGGPFFQKSKDELKSVTVEDALRHPNWQMGRKITIDSATLMNKGLELIEAVHLFNKKPEEIEIIIHRESLLHSAVEYQDGAIIGQFGSPDMRLPIQYALTYPERLPSNARPFSFFDYKCLTFARPDEETFSALASCKEAIRRGGLYPAMINSANEKAVDLFLKRKISFLDISQMIREALNLKPVSAEVTLSSILETERQIAAFIDSYSFTR